MTTAEVFIVMDLFWNKEDARKEMRKQYRGVMKKVSEDHGKLPQGYVNTWDTGASICTDTCSADEYECEISERRIIVRARRWYLWGCRIKRVQ